MYQSVKSLSMQTIYITTKPQMKTVEAHGRRLPHSQALLTQVEEPKNKTTEVEVHRQRCDQTDVSKIKLWFINLFLNFGSPIDFIAVDSPLISDTQAKEGNCTTTMRMQSLLKVWDQAINMIMSTYAS